MIATDVRKRLQIEIVGPPPKQEYINLSPVSRRRSAAEQPPLFVIQIVRTIERDIRTPDFRSLPTGKLSSNALKCSKFVGNVFPIGNNVARDVRERPHNAPP